MQYKRLTVVTGHYGSGKTNFSVNLALDIAKDGQKCTVIDLDIVNPYFRTADFEKLFGENGIDIFAPVYANTNLDIPSLNIPLESLMKSGSHIVIDVGGDDEGAKALGRFAPIINGFEDTDILYVINKYRYLTKDPADTAVLMREIEESGSVRCTGIVNNSSLGGETDIDDVISSLSFAEKVSELTGLPIAATCALAEAMPANAPEPYIIKRYVRNIWEK